MPLIFKFLKKWTKIIWTIFEKTGTFSENSEQKFESMNIFWIYEQILWNGNIFWIFEQNLKNRKKIEIRIFFENKLEKKKRKRKKKQKKREKKKKRNRKTKNEKETEKEKAGSGTF